MNNNPYFTTYKTERIPLVGNTESRDSSSTKDQRFINFFPEIIKSGQSSESNARYHLRQRAGLVYQSTITAGTGRGIYYYNSSTFTAIGNQLYRNGAAFQTLGSSTGQVGFCEYQGLVNYLVVYDGTSGWIIDNSNVITQITDVDFPSPHIPFPVYIDGYLLAVHTNSGDIYNCDINAPLTWQAGNFISAEMAPDTITAMVRQNNYVCALGSETIEFFYDAANATGTPLARNSAAFQSIGVAAPNTTIDIESTIMFVGQTGNGGRSVWAITDFQPREIADEPVKLSLNAEGTNISNAIAFCVRSMGHKFYVINLTSRTWVYDFEEDMWHEWANSTNQGVFNCNYSTDNSSGQSILLDKSLGVLYKLTDNISTDSSDGITLTSITSTIITALIDFDSMDRKFGNRLTVIGDTISGQTISVYWTDDNYVTYSTAISLSIASTMPSMTQLGSFRRRAFKFVYAGSSPWRVEAFELKYNKGTQ